jgi:superfamily II DNA/RNA helicase
MKPEADSLRLLGAVRATAKMHEFRVAEEDFVRIPKDPQTLFSLAIGILGDGAAAIADHFISPDKASGRPMTWSEEDGSLTEMIGFSATFFDAYLEARLDGIITTEFSVLCAGSYYLSDNVGSAAVVVRRSDPPPLELGHGLALLVFKILREDFTAIDAEFSNKGTASRLLSTLRGYFALESDASEVAAICNEMRSKAYENGSARELLYADVAAAICSRKIRNSARNLVPPSSNLSLELWRPALTKSHFPLELWPAQRRICEAGLLKGESAIIQMPTSAGKTRATEMIIRSLFLSGRSSLAIIIAPFRSLCHDIRSDLARAFAGDGIILDEISDSYLFDLELESVLAQKSILILTPEKMLYMLRRAPELAETIGLVIYDEGHQFEGLRRGPTYELLLSSLRMSLTPKAQVILISAVIGNAPEIAEWLLRNREGVVQDRGLLPTRKSIAFTSWKGERGQLQYIRPNDPDEVEFFVPRVIDKLPLKKKNRRERDRVFPERDRPLEYSEAVEIGLYVALHLIPNGSAALFCGQKSTVSKVLRRAVEIFSREVSLFPPLASSNAEEVKRIAALTRAHLGDNSDAALAADLGVLGHHSNVPHGIRLAVEFAMKMGYARFVICTSTLAQGVNFPLKYLVITATQQGREKIRVRDFHNLMGRAGRAGMHTEASVIFSAPNIFDGRKSINDRWRWKAVKDLLDPANAEPSQSAILEIFEPYFQDDPPFELALDAKWLDLAFADHAKLDEIVTIFVKQYPKIAPAEFKYFMLERARVIQHIAAYLAAYVDFDADQASERIDELARNTLAYHLATEEIRENLLEVFRLTAKALSENADQDFRALIRRSPLPPADILDLQKWLKQELTDLKQLLEKGNLDQVLWRKLLPYARPKAITAISDQSLILPALNSWLNGMSFAEILKPMVLAQAKVGRFNVTVDHIVNLCEGGFGYELSMLAAAIADLLEDLDDDLHEAILVLQKRIKVGLSNVAGLAFYEAGFADRVVAARLGVAFPRAVDRAGVRSICRDEYDRASLILADYPLYFSQVLREYAGR